MPNESLQPIPRPRARKLRPDQEAERDRRAIEEYTRGIARSTLLGFQAYTDASYRINWHHALLGRYLEKAARRQLRRLLISQPPRTGKTGLVSIGLPAYFLGINPSLKVLSTTHTADLAHTNSRKVQRLIMSPAYRELFPSVGLKELPPADFSGDPMAWVQRDAEFDLVGQGANYRCAGVGGALAGTGGDLIIIDDPIRNRKEAQSKRFRDDLWDWFHDDVETRDEGGASMIVTATRWDADDLIGRLINSQKVVTAGTEDEEDADLFEGEKWILINLPAILDKEEDRFTDPERGESDPRKLGETLWPWRWSGRRDDIPLEAQEKISRAKLDRRRAANPFGFEALFQGRPTPRGGEFFKTEKFQIVKYLPSPRVRTCRYWDKAGTEGGGKRTAGVKMSILKDGSFIIEHVHKGQWSAGRREAEIKQVAQLDGHGVIIRLEQEPGSGGKESAESTVKNLRGFNVRAKPVSGDKGTRAEPFASQLEIGNIYMMEGPWNQDYIEELRRFTPVGDGGFKDQVDASSGAFNELNASGGGSLAALARAN